MALTWLQLCEHIRQRHSNDIAKLPLLRRNQVADEIVVGWIGAELYDDTPEAVLPDETLPEMQMIEWLWAHIDFERAMKHAKLTCTSSDAVLLMAMNMLISHAMILPNGTVPVYIGDWYRLESQYMQASRIITVDKAEEIVRARRQSQQNQQGNKP